MAEVDDTALFSWRRREGEEGWERKGRHGGIETERSQGNFGDECLGLEATSSLSSQHLMRRTQQ